MKEKIKNFCDELQNLESLVKQAELNVGAKKLSAWAVSSKQEDINKFIGLLIDIDSQYELEQAESDIFANNGEWFAQERCATWNALCSVLLVAYRQTKHKAEYIKALCEFDEANNISNILYDEYIKDVPYETRQEIINSYFKEYGYDENKLIFLSCSEREEYEYIIKLIGKVFSTTIEVEFCSVEEEQNLKDTFFENVYREINNKNINFLEIKPILEKYWLENMTIV